jgi:hypothetical protein
MGLCIMGVVPPENGGITKYEALEESIEDK